MKEDHSVFEDEPMSAQESELTFLTLTMTTLLHGIKPTQTAQFIFLPAEHGFSSYVSTLPASARPHLEQLLDWGHGGVDKDLCEIAHHMLNWEVQLAPHLGLTSTDISDIKTIYSNNPALQR